MIGSSMGGTAALQHACHANRVLAFGPRVDLRTTHGSFVPTASQRACLDAVHASLEAMRGSVAVHAGLGNLVDMHQAGLVSGARGVTLETHDTFHHNVPMYLEREGLLVTLFKQELLELLTPSAGAHDVK